MFGIAFEYEALWNTAQADHGKYFAPDFEAKFILPLQSLGSARKGKTPLADGIEIHATESLSNFVDWIIESLDQIIQ